MVLCALFALGGSSYGGILWYVSSGSNLSFVSLGIVNCF